MANHTLGGTHFKVQRAYTGGLEYSGEDVLRRAEAAAILDRMGLSRKQALVLSGLLSIVSDAEFASPNDHLFDYESV